MKCQHCERTCEDNRWAKTRAWSRGWFFSKDDQQAFCPDHLPSWVDRWRAMRREAKS